MERREFLTTSARGAVAVGAEGVILPYVPGKEVPRVAGGEVVEEVLGPELIA